VTRLLHSGFVEQAAKQPDAIALADGGTSIAYGELDRLTNRLARRLQAAGCANGDRVGILVPKSIAAIAGILAALKAGCIYVPLDPSSPAPRLSGIVDSCECRVVLRGTGLPAFPGRASIDVDAFVRYPGNLSDGPLDAPRAPGDIAHILFTSGSTGMPKGVPITHAAVLAFLDWALPYFGHAPSDRISSHPPLHFDLSTFDIFGALSSGASLYLIPPGLSLLPHKIAAAIRDLELTQWFSVPSLLNYMARFDVVRPRDFPKLKRLLWCGEPFPAPALIYWMRRLPHVTFTNLYGPTETTIASSYYTLAACPESETAAVPIGRPCSGEEMLVLDADSRPAAPGVLGDLYIRGVGLSPGYWNDPGKTAAVFLYDAAGRRIYKTGDLASTDENGLFYLHGRTDAQVKSRGYRIELGEIETVLSTFEEVRECAVTAVPTAGFEGHAICCAYAPAAGREVTPQALRKKLGEFLPAYMLPSRWISAERLPLNGNGKIDRAGIRASFATRVEG
jgi:amino acid adenylation domain-containing protein